MPSPVVVELVASVKGFEKDLASGAKALGKFVKDVVDELGKFSKKLMLGAGAVLGLGVALFALVKSGAAVGAELNDLSEATGLTVETLSRLRYIAGITGGDMGDVSFAVRTMTRALYASDEESAKVAETFGYLGLSVDHLRTLKPDQLFLEVARALAKVQDPSKRLALAQQVLGRGALQLVPMIMKVGREYEVLSGQARKYGQEWSAADAKRAEAFTMAWNKVKAVVGGIMDSFAKGFFGAGADGLQTFADKLAEWVPKAIEWGKKLGSIVKGLASIVFSTMEKIKKYTAGAFTTLLEWLVKLDQNGDLDRWARRIIIGFAGVIGVGKIMYNTLKLVISYVKVLLFQLADYTEYITARLDKYTTEAEKRIWGEVLRGDMEGLKKRKELLDKYGSQTIGVGKAFEKGRAEDKATIAVWERLQTLRASAEMDARYTAEQEAEIADIRTTNARRAEIDAERETRIQARMNELIQNRLRILTEGGANVDANIANLEKKLGEWTPEKALEGIGTAYSDMLDTAQKFDPAKAGPLGLEAMIEYFRNFKTGIEETTAEVQDMGDELEHVGGDQVKAFTTAFKQEYDQLSDHLKLMLDRRKEYIEKAKALEKERANDAMDWEQRVINFRINQGATEQEKLRLQWDNAMSLRRRAAQAQAKGDYETARKYFDMSRDLFMSIAENPETKSAGMLFPFRGVQDSMAQRAANEAAATQERKQQAFRKERDNYKSLAKRTEDGVVAIRQKIEGLFALVSRNVLTLKTNFPEVASELKELQAAFATAMGSAQQLGMALEKDNLSRGGLPGAGWTPKGAAALPAIRPSQPTGFIGPPSPSALALRQRRDQAAARARMSPEQAAANEAALAQSRAERAAAAEALRAQVATIRARQQAQLAAARQAVAAASGGKAAQIAAQNAAVAKRKQEEQPAQGPAGAAAPVMQNNKVDLAINIAAGLLDKTFCRNVLFPVIQQAIMDGLIKLRTTTGGASG